MMDQYLFLGSVQEGVFFFKENKVFEITKEKDPT